MKCCLSSKLSLIAFSAVMVSARAAEFQPIALSAESYNQDVVVEEGATPPPALLTTASMDTGAVNTEWSWHEQGFAIDAPHTGLPVAGSTLVSESFPDHTFQFAPSYATNNAILVDSTTTNGAFAVTTPAAFSSLSFLTAAGAGTATVAVTVRHADGSIETNSFEVPDWFGGAEQAFTANGRVDVRTRALGNLDSGEPRLYSRDIALSNSASPVTNIELTYAAGAGHAAVFAVSGAAGAGFNPIAVTGYNHDLVLEAAASAAPTPLLATTASVDAGLANTQFTYYEQGYNSAAPSTGLPSAGSVITNAAAADQFYRFAASYTNNNAILIDSESSGAALTLVTPAAFSGLSLLTAAGNGAVTIDYTINHSGGAIQTGTFVSPDWFNATPVAFTASGRVNVDNGSLDSVGSTNPRLYAVDLSVQNSTAPISSINLSYNSGTGHAVIFAVSGAGGEIKPIIDTHPVSTNVFLGSPVQLTVTASGTGTLQYQWQKGSNGAFTNVSNSGNISGAQTANFSISSVTLNDAGSYQVLVSNGAGASTSLVAQINVLSSATDVTSPSDEIASFGGDSPAAEMVVNAIDNTTTKYLNFGTDADTVPPFAGPAGLVVTPAAGSTVVTGLRVFTANDAEERDPADYKLEGSNDAGATYTEISSGSLILPAGRNAAALELDPLAQPNQEVLFQNTAGYTTYRLTFTNVKNNTNVNSVQVGEIELLGVPGTGTPSVRVTIARAANGALTITSSQPGTLQSTPALNGEETVWETVGPIDGSITVTPGTQSTFYRVVAQ